MSLRRQLTSASLGAVLALATFGAVPAVAATGNAVLAQCTQPQGLTGHFTVAQLHHALQIMSAETKEYTSCPDVINRALLAALSTSHGAQNGTGGGSGSFLPTPVIVILVLLALAAVTFGAIAIRRRRAAEIAGRAGGGDVYGPSGD